MKQDTQNYFSIPEGENEEFLTISSAADKSGRKTKSKPFKFFFF